MEPARDWAALARPQARSLNRANRRALLVDEGRHTTFYTDGFAVRGEAPPESVEAALGHAHLEELDPLLDRLLAHVLTSTDDKVHDDIALLAARVI